MIWHTHLEPPGEAENALIASTGSDGQVFLSGMAVNRAGRWYSEIFDDSITAPYWWLDERELLALIQTPCNHVWYPPDDPWIDGPAFCLRCKAQITRTREYKP